MYEDTPKPLARARARIEAERAKAEIWFHEQARKDKTRAARDETLVDYVFDVFGAAAQEIFSAGLELRWPTAEVRQWIEEELDSIIEEAFSSKHYYREAVGNHLYQASFRQSTANQIRASQEWRQIQTKLLELAAWEAAGGDHQCCLDRAAYPFHHWLAGPDPKQGFSSPVQEGEYWRKKAWKGFHALIQAAKRRGTPASRNEKLAHAIDGLTYDLAVLKANEILERGLRGESAIKTFRDESTNIQEQIESAWRASGERKAVSVEDDQKKLQDLAQLFHRVRDDLRRMLDSVATTEEHERTEAVPSENGPTHTKAESAVNLPHPNETDQRATINAFISKMAGVGRKITRKNIWTVAGYKDRTEFERFQRGDTRTTQTAAGAFDRVLSMKPEIFIESLDKKSVAK